MPYNYAFTELKKKRKELIQGKEHGKDMFQLLTLLKFKALCHSKL